MINKDIRPFSEYFLDSIISIPIILSFKRLRMFEEEEINLEKVLPFSTEPIKSRKEFNEFFKEMNEL